MFYVTSSSSPPGIFLLVHTKGYRLSYFVINCYSLYIGQLSAEECLPEYLFTTNLIWLVRLPFLEFQHVSVWNDQMMKPQSDLAVCQASFLLWYLHRERDKQKKNKLQHNIVFKAPITRYSKRPFTWYKTALLERGDPLGQENKEFWLQSSPRTSFALQHGWSSNPKVTPLLSTCTAQHLNYNHHQKC